MSEQDHLNREIGKAIVSLDRELTRLAVLEGSDPVNGASRIGLGCWRLSPGAVKMIHRLAEATKDRLEAGL